MTRNDRSPLPHDSRWEAKLPASIGRFKVAGKLGKGGFGVAYHARDPDLLRDVVIKIPHQLSDESTERFLFEVQTVAKLNHRGVVTVHEFGRASSNPPIPDGAPFAVMEYFEAGSLQQMLLRQRPNHDFTTGLLAAVADTIHEVHGHGIIHRDLKPENILLDTHSKPHVCDFGLALQEVLQAYGSERGGTLPYMSPEQLLCDRLDPRTDIWSLGIVLYRMLTGSLPFPGNTDTLLAEILEASPKPLRQHDQTIPDYLESVCLKCLQREASNRYTTAAELAQALRGGSDPPPIERLGIRFVPIFRNQNAIPQRHDRHFYLAETFVSEDDWARITKQSGFVQTIPEMAKTNVSYSDIQNFLRIANSQLTDARFDLPTVEQWDLVVDARGVSVQCGLDAPWLKRGKPSSAGVYDLLGVAWQYCRNRNRVELRGGSFRTHFEDTTKEPIPRVNIPTTAASAEYGFRVVLIQD